MPTECSPALVDFAPAEGRRVVAAFDGGAITANAGALLFSATDRAINLVGRFAACFGDARMPERVEHDLATLVGQRIFGIALGHEEVVDHDQLRHDPVLAVLAGKLAARRRDCAPLAGKSTLNWLEHAPAGEPGRHHGIGHDAAAIEGVLVDLFLEAHRKAPAQADHPRSRRHRRSPARAPGRPLLPRLLRRLLLPAALRLLRRLLRPAPAGGQASPRRHRRLDRRGRGRIVRRLRACWPRVRILLRADSGFVREALMA